jgi:hypothetical protein
MSTGTTSPPVESKTTMIDLKVWAKAVKGISPCDDGRYIIAKGQSGLMQSCIIVQPETGMLDAMVVGLGSDYRSTIHIKGTSMGIIDAALEASKRLGESYDDIRECFDELRDELKSFWSTSK